MCRNMTNIDSGWQRKVSDVIANLIRDSKMFSAYDITRILRFQNPDDTIVHADIRKLVHRNDMQGYRRRMSSDKAFLVYFDPDIHIPDTYDPDALKPQPETPSYDPVLGF